MKKIVTAMGNETLNDELKKYTKYDLYENDLYYQDAVIDVVTEYNYDILIVSALLQGQFEFGEFIEKIRKIDRKIRIVVITDELNDYLKRKLNDNDIVDIFFDDRVTLSEIIDAIDREEPLLQKYMKIKNDSMQKVSENKNEKYENEIANSFEKNIDRPVIVNEIIQKQEIIVISGTNGSGKSTVAANFSRILSGKTSSKILLIDLDTLNGNLDEILDIHKVPQNVEIILDENKKCGLNYAVELISKNRFDTNILDEIVINAGGIDVLTGNTSLHYCQNVLTEEHYNRILECAKEKYDFIVIDTSSNIFLDSTKWSLQQASRVFFVTENNYVSMKKASQLISVFTDNWKIWKNKIEIIINKERPSGIEFEVVEKILSDYKVIGKIKNEEENDDIQYIKMLETINYIPKQSIISRFLSKKYIESFPIKNLSNTKVKRNEVIRSAN
ncbi:MAG: AAA family ATPase [Clostridia bacterium]|nr:AAA family ATPase [Clostridia bacterium]